MNSTRQRLASGRNGKRGISLPDMAPFAFVVLLVAFFYMSSSRFRQKEIGIVTLEQLVAHTPITCTKGLDSDNVAIISLNTKKQYSFAAPAFDNKIQAEIFRRVASLHQVDFTKSQIGVLETLPFLAVDVKELPAFLNLSLFKRQELLRNGIYQSLDSLQLSECIRTSREVARENHRNGPYVNLMIESAVKMPYVDQLIALVNAQGTNRFVLLTQSNHIDYPLGLPAIQAQ
ncbi:hypothetical protein I2I05_10365 [Hymenobacter sp. BT683]|uniref:Biopolymer transporter ExbD n=1 Tax=Hymenobacter jeongseonensis TaxID=2791027 RepID=A0ABS0IHG0_9BACT|nr:hypothetical protein [Hymenobacter jeongseonensis]MBF9237798.1 hypothetical protein [Hymenobacter jeongseonensis]